MGENITEKNDNEMYVYLDFNGKLANDVFEKQVFLRIANLHTNHPLVQVNDTVFKGVYDYSIGTNLFFEEMEDAPPPGNAFEKQTPIYLKHILSETKVINLKAVKVPQQKAKITNEVKKIEFNLDWDYNKLLEKFENGTLHIENIVKKKSQIQNVEMEKCTENEESQVNEWEMDTAEVETESEQYNREQNILNNIEPANILEAEYEKLKILARRPVRRAMSPELVTECDKIYKASYDYHNVERQVLQPCDRFRNEKVADIDESTLSDCVDIDRCVLYGIILPSSNFPRILTKEEKQKVLTLENFDNLSIAARYYVLESHVDDLDKYIKSLSKDKLKQKDEFGRTPVQTLEIYKKLSEAVKNRIQEIKYSANS